MKNKIILACMVIFNAFGIVPPQNKEKSIVQKVEQHFLSNFDWECESLHVSEKWSFKEFLNNCLDQQKNLKEITKAKIVFKILNSNYEQSANNCIIDTVVWDDLCLYRNLKNKKSSNIARKVDRTHTYIGKGTLYTMLAQPIDNVEKLLARQKVLKTVIEDKNLFNFLDVNFAKLKKYENLFLSFQTNDPLGNVIENQYIDFNKDLNKYETSLTIKNAFDHQKRTVLLLAKLIATVALPVYGVSKILDRSSGDNFNQLSERLISSGDTLLGLISMAKNNQIQGSVSIFAGVSSALSAKKQFDEVKNSFMVLKYMQEKLVHVSLFLTIADNVAKYLKQYESAYNELDVKDIHDLMNVTAAQSKELRQLIDSLQTDTFKNVSIFSNSGRILATYKRFNELKYKFNKLVCSLGKIDAFLSFAKLYKENESKANYCFANYHVSKTPFVKVQDLWNPIIDEAKVVKNAVSFGADNSARNVIITGDNEGGKSTIIRTIAVNIIFAQTFGIVPAKSMDLTLFNKIGTYINITDDVAAGNSLFKAQVNRTIYLIDYVKKLESDKFWFLAFDEPLNGTEASVAQAIFYCIMKDLGQYNNNLCLLSTHCAKLSELESEDNKRFVNYKVTAFVDAQGKVNCNYILERGVSHQNTAIAILRAQGFNNAILDDAHKMVSAA